MKYKKIIVLLIVFFGLLTWAVYINKRPPAETAATSRLMEGRDFGSVTGFVLYNSKNYLTINKDGEGWNIITPDSCAADPERVSAFLLHLFGLHYFRELKDGLGDYKAFGLKEKTAFCILSCADAASDTLFMGAATPKGNRYLQLNSHPSVYTVHAEFGQHFETGLEDWKLKTN